MSHLPQLKIGFISYEFPTDTGNGGIGTYVKQMAAAIAAVDVQIHVFVGSKERVGSVYTEGYNVHFIKCINGDEFREQVVSVFDKQQAIGPFSLIESPEINGNAWEVKKKYINIPLVVRLHAPNHLVEKLKKKYIPFFAKLRFVLGAIRRLKFDLGYWQAYDKTSDPDYQFIQLADYITAPSVAMKNWVVKNWKIDAHKITVIPNLFSPSPSLLNIPINEVETYNEVVFFGRLNALKGLVNATRAMKVILKLYPDWSFKVIGDDGPGPSNVLTMRNWMVKELKDFSHQVEFIDGLPYEELPAAIAQSEIVLLPSLFESFSYTCAEAMAAGKAVIGSDNAAMADLLQHGKSGLLVNPYDFEAIIAALKKIINNNTLRVQLSTQARIRIINDFNSQNTLNAFMEFYKKVIVE